MAIPKKKKNIVKDIGAAVQKAAGQDKTTSKSGSSAKKKQAAVKTGRPSPRTGKVERMTLLLSEKTAERLTIAYATEQVQRKKKGDKLDKSLLIEEAIEQWLDDKGF